MLAPLVSLWVPHAFVISFKLETNQNLLIDKSRDSLNKYNHKVRKFICLYWKNNWMFFNILFFLFIKFSCANITVGYCQYTFDTQASCRLCYTKHIIWGTSDTRASIKWIRNWGVNCGWCCKFHMLKIYNSVFKIFKLIMKTKPLHLFLNRYANTMNIWKIIINDKHVNDQIFTSSIVALQCHIFVEYWILVSIENIKIIVFNFIKEWYWW